jgi:uncharacterized membrane protein
MNARANQVLAIALIAIFAVICTMALPSAALRVIAGLLLVGYLPGHTILRVIDPEQRRDLTGVVFAAGLSIAVTVACGLLLNLIGPLTPARWAMALGAVTVLASGVASMRNRHQAATPHRPIGIPTLRAGQAVMLACTGLIVVATVVWTRHDLLAHPEFAYTELWMVPGERSGAVTIGIRNVERVPSSYDLEVTLDDGLVATRRSIALVVGESWISDFALPMREDETHTAEARLYRHGHDRAVYRRVWLKTGSREP